MSLLAVNLPSLWAVIGNMSSPASRFVASIRSALSLRLLGSSAAVGGGDVDDGNNRYVDDSQVRTHERMKGQIGEWHRLEEIDSQETGADAIRSSDGTDFVARREIGIGDSTNFSFF